MVEKITQQDRITIALIDRIKELTDENQRLKNEKNKINKH